MLFIKRLSDEFDRKREQLRRRDFAHIDEPELLKELLEDKTSYGDTFFVPPRAGMEVYAPTAASGGFLIQTHAYIEEQGQNADDLALYGQDSNGTVWSICNMNMIFSRAA